MKCLVLAGGIGQRLWPLSTDATPKQVAHWPFLSKPLLVQTLERLYALPNLNSPADVSVVLPAEQVDAVVECLKAYVAPEAQPNLIIEPEARNTAPAILYAIKTLFTQQQTCQWDEPLLIAPCDHIIEDTPTFIADVAEASIRVHSLKYPLVAFGTKPKWASPHYGYWFTAPSASQNGPFPLSHFVEKPPVATAQSWLEHNETWWHTGILMTTAQGLMLTLRENQPELYRWASQSNLPDLHDTYGTVPNLAVDHALLELIRHQGILWPLHTAWWDLGSWESIYDFLPKDSNGNAIVGPASVTQCEQSLLINLSDTPQEHRKQIGGIHICTADHTTWQATLPDWFIRIPTVST